MTLDTNTIEQLTVDAIAAQIVEKARALSTTMFQIRDCAGETLENGLEDLHLPFEDNDVTEGDIRSMLERINSMLDKGHDLLEMFKPQTFPYEQEVETSFQMEASVSLEYEVKAFSQEAADELNDDLDDDSKMERADVGDISSYDVTLPDPWVCDDISQ
jgi:hypothetical protein